MKLGELQEIVIKHENFNSFADCAKFAGEFLKYVRDNKQAVIVSQNEHNYHFFQFNEEAHYTISRPFNDDLIIEYDDFNNCLEVVLKTLNYLEIIKIRQKVILKIP